VSAKVLILAVSAGLLLAGVGLSLIYLFCARSHLRARAAVPAVVSNAAIEVLQQRLESLEAEVREICRQAPAGPGPPPPRAGLNLQKRSHALRMHRRGEGSAGIAAALDLPLQEVELLIKVHRIVLKNL
jgi:hypothetical protein